MESDFEREVARYFRRNAIANVVDGACFWWAMSFIAARTILPLYVRHYTDSTLVIGLLSAIGSGWFLPQLFTANWVERLPRKKFAVVNIGAFTERLPIVLMAPTALLATRFPGLAVPGILLCYAWFTMGSGAVAVAWQDMLAKVVPVERRARLFGLTNFIGMGGGALTALAASRLLDRHGFPDGYILSFAAAAALMGGSWFALALIHEPAQLSPSTQVPWRTYWRRLPALLRADGNFRRFLGSQVVVNFGAMASGFLAVYAVQRWGLGDEQASLFTVAMLVGQSLSNLGLGVVGDRHGHKRVLELSALLGALAAGVAVAAPSPAWFYAAFALSGASFAGFYQSGVMISMEFSEPEVRPTYIGLANTVNGVSAILASLVAGGVAQMFGFRPLFAISLGAALAAFAALRWSVREPRGAAVPVRPAVQPERWGDSPRGLRRQDQNEGEALEGTGQRARRTRRAG